MRYAETEGYKAGEKKTLAEYAQLDAEDESLARWKASLGILPGASAGAATGPKVRFAQLAACHRWARPLWLALLSV